MQQARRSPANAESVETLSRVRASAVTMEAMEELSEREIDAFLHRQVVGRVGCHVDGRTYVVPVIYAWNGSSIYVLSIEGRKIEMMRANPNVCFEVDEYRPGAWRSVIVEGVYEELDGARVVAAIKLLMERFGRTRSRAARSGRAPVAFCIRPTAVTGRRMGRPGRRLSLRH
jgi:nitroimidazol reductase NimA-like FMN-containing flavoprotein (pyridoxamine 5'-phosphate oxidase superfamily)